MEIASPPYEMTPATKGSGLSDGLNRNSERIPRSLLQRNLQLCDSLLVGSG